MFICMFSLGTLTLISIYCCYLILVEFIIRGIIDECRINGGEKSNVNDLLGVNYLIDIVLDT